MGTLSAPIDTSWGTTLDVNGDGYADAIVGATGANLSTGKAYVYLGSASGLSSAAAVTLVGSNTGDQFGWSVASAGDVNGDGYADVIVGAPTARNAYLYLGSATGLPSLPSTSLASPGSASGTFGVAVASVGDVNGDGYADVVIADPVVGLAYVYFGSAAGLPSSPSADFQGSFVSGSVGSAGDINGDGYGDIVAGAHDAGNSGSVFVYLGGPYGPPFAPSITLGPGATGDDLGGSVASAGDVNGDGYADVVVGADGVNGGNGAAYLYLGSSSGLSVSPSLMLTGSAGKGAFGESVAGAGDVNGDGYADVIVGAGGANNGDGASYVFLGLSSGLSANPVVALAGPAGARAAFGFFVAGAGDVNGDNYADVIIGAEALNTADGAAYIYLGEASGVLASPSSTLHPAGSEELFGSAVASVWTGMNLTDPRLRH